MGGACWARWLVLCLGGTFSLTASGAAQEEATCVAGGACGPIPVETWVGDSPASAGTAHPLPEPASVAHKPATAVSFPGGGTRAFSVGLGVVRALRALGLEDKPKYFTMVSGGNWFGNAYLYAKTDDEESLVGPYVPPETLTRDALAVPYALATAPSATGEAFGDRFTVAYDKCLLDGLVHRNLSMTDCWKDVTHARFAAPFGIAKDELFAFDAAQADELRRKDASLTSRAFATVRTRGSETPPFPLTNFAVLGPTGFGPQDDTNYSMAVFPPICATPVSAGPYIEPRDVEFFLTFELEPKEKVVDKTYTLGGLAETFAFGAPLSTTTTSTDDSITTKTTTTTTGPFFALADAMSISSLAMGASAKQLANFLPGLVAPGVVKWEEKVEAFAKAWLLTGENRDGAEFALGDGGNSGDNGGFHAVLQRKVKKLFVVLPTQQMLNVSWDPYSRPPTETDIDKYFAAYFGQPVANDDVKTNIDVYGWNLEKLVFFDGSAFAPLVAQLIASAKAGSGAFAKTTVTTVKNEYFAVEAGLEVELVVMQPHFDVAGICRWTLTSGLCPHWYQRIWPRQTSDAVSLWFDQLPKETRTAIFRGKRRKLSHYHNFPFYDLLTQQTLYVDQVNLLANFVAWSVLQHNDTMTDLFGA